MGIKEIMSALPISGIEAQSLCRITGFVTKSAGEILEPSVEFFEPPAGQSVPYIDPVEALSLLFRADGKLPDEVRALAISEYALLRPELPLLKRPRLYRYCEVMDVAECIPVPLFIAFLRKRVLISEDFITFLEQVCDVICRVRTFRLSDDWDEPILLSQLPDLPPTKVMIEFFIGLQSDIAWEIEPQGVTEGHLLPQQLLDWREAVRPIAANLEQVLGEKVYHFQDLDDELDDDCCHRFFALHCWCSLLPESSFVKYLLEVTGFTDVEALKAVLIDPASYTSPFIFNDAFVGIEAVNCRLIYLPPNQKRRVGIAFRTEAAKLRAKEIALMQIGAKVLFLAPRHLITEYWMKEATIFGCALGVWHDFDKPIAFLSEVDEIHVVSDENRTGRGFDLKVGPALEVLMWQAYQSGIKMYSDSPSASILGNPELCLKKCGVPERVTAIDEKRHIFTQQLQTLIVSPDYGSSGLWDDQGRNIPCDLIDLPFALIKRLVAWQRDYDDTLIPLLPETADDDWWKCHETEHKDIIKAIQEALGDKIDVRTSFPKSSTISRYREQI